MLLRSHGGGNCSGDGGAHEGGPDLHPTDFWSMRHFAEYDIWSKTIVRYDVRSNCQVIVFDQTSDSTERRIYQMSLIIKRKKENHKKSLCLPNVQLIGTLD